jgi:hypothetical protein
MKEIQLINSKQKAKVDDEDYEYINQFKWFETPNGYAATELPRGAGVMYMHHMVLERARQQRN